MTTKKHGTQGSVSSAASLLQDVPSSFPTLPAHVDEQPAFQSLSQAVFARRSEYVRPEHVRIKVGSWNVAALKGTEKDLAGWFIQGKGVVEALTGLEVKDQELLHGKDVPESNGSVGHEPVEEQEARFNKKQSSIPAGDQGTITGDDDIGLYVLALQEVVDVNAVTEALRPFSDPSTSKKWKDALEAALPKGYMLIAEQQLIGLLLLVYAAPEIGKEIRGVSTTSVGTGIGGYMGNKGAVTARIVLGDTTRIVFVNSHLAAGADKTALERRNWDASQIIQRTRFAPLQDVMDLQQTTGEQLGDEDFAFWAGDLNYRLEGIPGDDVRRLLMLHTRNEYDLSQAAARKVEKEIEQATRSIEKRARTRGSTTSSISSMSEASDRNSMDSIGSAPTLLDEVAESDDPTSLQTTLNSLLPHDELHLQMKARKAFHDGWREGLIRFLPTYKYDLCDRILYRTRRDKLAFDAMVAEEENAKKKDAEMKAKGTDQAGTDEDILYDYDPEQDAANDDYDEYDEDDTHDGVVVTKGGFEDALTLECYVTHQRVLSSDHKPLDAVFLLKYDRVVPDLKAKVHADVVKELDKTENESKPTVTVVVDKHRADGKDQSDVDPASFEGVWFGDVRWGQAKHRNLTIANTGQVSASFTLIERPIGPGQDTGVAPSWLNIKFDDDAIDSAKTSTKSITLEPGDTINVALEIRVLDLRMIRALNDGAKTLEDILLLRVDGGRDHFIPVRARWQDTSLGRGIEKLIRIPEGGIRKLQRQSPEASSKKDLDEKLDRLSLDSPVQFSAPRELFRLTEAIEELSTRVIAEWHMTASDDLITAPWDRYSGWPFDEDGWTERKTLMWSDALSDLCDALDSDVSLVESFPERVPQNQRLYMLCNLLLVFLCNIPSGILTEPQWSQIEHQLAEHEKLKHKPDLEGERTAIQEILATSPPNNICFILVTTMLDRIAKELAGPKNAHEPQAESSGSKTSALRRMTGFVRSSSPPKHADSGNSTRARIIAEAAIHPSEDGTDKQKAVHTKRKQALIELFMTKEEPR
ncbi:hypothetical protein AMS68_004490 [Peltaster fructicola]|uniref:Inositol polyphosphate-related phosphatase domain-containing protein n=1 Tax=Peltaster fructicola TaxID=286661 RepID=A0A6H0XW44_9PEZI|nr:hypothetical protein AMS68_004490 [Peltaster fructicola]